MVPNLKIGAVASGLVRRGRGIFIGSLCPKGMGVYLESRFLKQSLMAELPPPPMKISLP